MGDAVIASCYLNTSGTEICDRVLNGKPARCTYSDPNPILVSVRCLPRQVAALCEVVCNEAAVEIAGVAQDRYVCDRAAAGLAGGGVVGT